MSAHLDAHPGTESGSATLELGYMLNATSRSAFGGAVFLRGGEPVGGFGVRARYRRRLNIPLSLDVAPGIVLASRGLTTIRDVETEGAMYADVDLKRAVNEGVIPGPRMFVSTRAFSATGMYPLQGYSWELVMPSGVQVVDGVDAIRRAVREQVRFGADWIKFYADRRYYVADDGTLRSWVNFTGEEMRALVDEAHRLGRPVAAHRLGREDQLRYRRGRVRLDRAAGARVQLHGALWDDPDAGHQVRHQRRPRATRPATELRRHRAGAVRGHHRRERQPAPGHQ